MVLPTLSERRLRMRLGNRWIIVLTVLSLAGFTGRASAQKHALHHLHHALWELRDAKKELKESTWTFGEHKVKAEHAIEDGIKQIELILKHSGEFAKGEPKRSDLREEYKKYGHHAHLHHAVVELRHAHKELKETRYTFGGHKEAALRDIEIAANQIEILLKHAKR
jgi:hypothetical protein